MNKMFRNLENAYKTCRFRACPLRGNSQNQNFDRFPFLHDGIPLKSLHFWILVLDFNLFYERKAWNPLENIVYLVNSIGKRGPKCRIHEILYELYMIFSHFGKI